MTDWIRLYPDAIRYLREGIPGTLEDAEKDIEARIRAGEVRFRACVGDDKIECAPSHLDPDPDDEDAPYLSLRGGPTIEVHVPDITRLKFATEPLEVSLKRGRKRQYSESDAYIEMGRIVYHEGLPDTAAELAGKIQLWFQEQGFNVPSTSWAEEKAGVFLRRIRVGL